MTSRPRRFVTAERGLRVGLWLLLLSVVATTRTDPDLWGHVRFGQDMLRDVSPWQTDPYSFTSDRPWVNHEWASEVAFGAAFTAGAGPGLIALKLLGVLGVLLLLNRVLVREGVADGRRRDLLVAAAVITTIQQAHHVRPQLFSLLFFAALLTCLVAARRRHAVLVALPVLFGAWANFHGGWIVGGGILLVWTLGVAASSGVRAGAVLVGAGVASLVATLVNPIGIGLHRFLMETVGFGRADITEWQPVYALGPSIWGMWALVLCLALAGGVRIWRTSRDPARMLVVASLAVASFRVNRLTAFFALATLFLFGPALAAALPRRREATAPRGRAVIVPAVIAVALVAAALRGLVVNAACVRTDPRHTPEFAAVEFFRAHDSQGRLLVWFDWGEFALWHLAPALRVSIDGRRETVYSAALQDRHLRFFFDAPGGAALPGELGADYIWIPRSLPIAGRLASLGWRAVYEGEQSVIFAREGDVRAATPSVPGPTANPPRSSQPACFPGS